MRYWILGVFLVFLDLFLKASLTGAEPHALSLVYALGAWTLYGAFSTVWIRAPFVFLGLVGNSLDRVLLSPAEVWNWIHVGIGPAQIAFNLSDVLLVWGLSSVLWTESGLLGKRVRALQ